MNDTERALFLAERAGKLTASHMADAMAFKKNGEPTEARTKLMRDLLGERLSDSSALHFVSAPMLHGLEYEDEAKMVYEAATGNLIVDGANVTPSGVFHHPKIDNFAATPDGLIGTDGLAEIKCPTTGTFVAWVLAGVVPEEYKPQMIAQCLCTGRDWVEFIAYDPRLRDESQRLFVRRFTPSEKECDDVISHAIGFLDELDAMQDRFLSLQETIHAAT